MNAGKLRKVGTIERELGLNAESQANAVDAELRLDFTLMPRATVWLWFMTIKPAFTPLLVRKPLLAAPGYAKR